jgi:beta-galactosidase
MRSTPSQPYRVVLTADTHQLAADGKDIAYLQARLVDAEGRLVGNAYDTVQFIVEGKGDLIGPSSHRLLAGLATLASVQSRTEEGEIRVRARVGRLKAGELVIVATGAKSSIAYE